MHGLSTPSSPPLAYTTTLLHAQACATHRRHALHPACPTRAVQRQAADAQAAVDKVADEPASPKSPRSKKSPKVGALRDSELHAGVWAKVGKVVAASPAAATHRAHPSRTAPLDAGQEAEGWAAEGAGGARPEGPPRGEAAVPAQAPGGWGPRRSSSSRAGWWLCGAAAACCRSAVLCEVWRFVPFAAVSVNHISGSAIASRFASTLQGNELLGLEKKAGQSMPVQGLHADPSKKIIESMQVRGCLCDVHAAREAGTRVRCTWTHACLRAGTTVCLHQLRLAGRKACGLCAVDHAGLRAPPPPPPPPPTPPPPPHPPPPRRRETRYCCTGTTPKIQRWVGWAGAWAGDLVGFWEGAPS